MAAVSVPMLQLTVINSKSRANMEARILYQSEILRARKLWGETSNQQAGFGNTALFSPKCTKGPDWGYETDGFNFQVSCTKGREVVGGEPVLLPYTLQAFVDVDQNGFDDVTGLPSRNPGQFSDEDNDGFEDISGLPTHYDQCYSGWKGDGFKNNACDIGGQYVIPMYADLYQ